jgi:hypothetical protein
MTYDFPKHIKGDTWRTTTFTVTVNDLAKDLTGATIDMNVRDCNAVSWLDMTNGTGITITDAANGVFQIDQQTLDIPAGLYSYDIQITDSDGVIATWIRGNITIIQDITY